MPLFKGVCGCLVHALRPRKEIYDTRVRFASRFRRSGGADWVSGVWVGQMAQSYRKSVWSGSKGSIATALHVDAAEALVH